MPQISSCIIFTSFTITILINWICIKFVFFIFDFYVSLVRKASSVSSQSCWQNTIKHINSSINSLN